MIEAVISFESGDMIEKQYESKECMEDVLVLLEHLKFADLGGIIVRSEEVVRIEYREVE